MAKNLLTNLKVKNATCPKGIKGGFLYADGGGLGLRVYEDGIKNWIVRLYRGSSNFNRGAGSYSDISLEQARKLRDEYKALWKQGIDPSIEKQKSKFITSKANQLTFEHVYKETLDNRIAKLSCGHHDRWTQTYDKYLKKPLAKLPLADIDDLILLKVIEDIYKLAPSTSQKARHQISVIFTYAKEKKWYRGTNPCNELKGNSLLALPKVKHHAYLDEHRVGEFLSKLDKHHNEFTKAFLKVNMLTALRVGSLREAKWSWYNDKTKVMNIPGAFMKSGEDFRCPLPTQAIKALEDLKLLSGGKKDSYIFEGNKNKPISESLPRLALQKMMNSKDTVHGFRTLYNRVVTKMGKFEIEKIEAQLTHAFGQTDIRKTYLGGEDFLDDRRKIVQAYADWCDKQ
jgi:integrase